MKLHLHPRRRAGFTFLEIMLVVAIIGILLAVVGPRLVGQSQKARITATKQQMQGIKTALGLYEMNVGTFPSTEQGLEALVERPSDVPEDIWMKCMDEIPTDPWDHEYVYAYPGEHDKDYDLSSTGADAKEGTEDDIVNWSQDEGAF